MIVLALRRSVATLARPRVWLYVLVPALVAFLVMLFLSLAVLDGLVAQLVEQPPMSWIVAWGAFWLAHLLAVLGGWMAILSASTLLALLLAAVLVLPLLLGYVAAVEYPELARRGADSFVAATWNSVAAVLLFLLGFVLTLPLWLVPGLGLVLPVFWMAWLNRRTFAYDVLSVHATDEEWRTLRRAHAMPLLGLGALMALLAHVPWLGTLAPSLAALTYIHYGLEALRRLRGVEK